MFAETKEDDNNTGTITDLLMQKCPENLSCVINGIQKSPRIPGNIAFIVELLHNISAVLTNVDEAKMQVRGRGEMQVRVRGAAVC